MPNPLDLDDGTSSTHISAETYVPVTSTQTSLNARASRVATLPTIAWGERGAVLQDRSVPRYEATALLGEGGMGAVMSARDNDIGREVAVKRLRQEHPELLARFVEEVRTVGQLEHPNIVPIHDAGVDDQGAFFVMKRVEGESLDKIIEKLAAGDRETHRRFGFERRVEIIRKVAEALRYAHAKGVVHRDIKPGNIHVGPMGEVFLLDWGIAQRAGHEEQAGQVIGTPLYMSPEQAAGAPVDARSDLYSLCVTLHEFLSLEHPYAKLETQAVLETIKTRKFPFVYLGARPVQGVTPWDLAWLVKKGVDADPSKRYRSADELIRAIDDRAEGKVPIRCPITLTKRTSYEVMRLVTGYPRAYMGVMAALAGTAIWLAVR
ncbi:MAG: serine/threonine-protein kinase [Myxococcaceae bacterium]